MSSTGQSSAFPYTSATRWMPSKPSKRVSVGCSSITASFTYPLGQHQSSVPSPDVAEYTEVRVGTKFLKAAQWAADRHVEYAGDVPGIPTVAQVLGLATLVLEDGGSQREAIAAMLLDALADDVPRKQLGSGFGKKTTRLVVAAHAHRGTIAPGRVPVEVDRWRGRADAALDVAVTEPDDGALRIRAACVLQETRARP